jgi:hypothetical protein
MTDDGGISRLDYSSANAQRPPGVWWAFVASAAVFTWACAAMQLPDRAFTVAMLGPGVQQSSFSIAVPDPTGTWALIAQRGYWVSVSLLAASPVVGIATCVAAAGSASRFARALRLWRWGLIALSFFVVAAALWLKLSADALWEEVRGKGVASGFDLLSFAISLMMLCAACGALGAAGRFEKRSQ